jgi:hypothetical protein
MRFLGITWGEFRPARPRESNYLLNILYESGSIRCWKISRVASYQQRDIRRLPKSPLTWPWSFSYRLSDSLSLRPHLKPRSILLNVGTLAQTSFRPGDQHQKRIELSCFQDYQSSPANFTSTTMQIRNQPIWHPTQMEILHSKSNLNVANNHSIRNSRDLSERECRVK